MATVLSHSALPCAMQKHSKLPCAMQTHSGLPGGCQRSIFRAPKSLPNWFEDPKSTVLTTIKLHILPSPLPKEIQVKKKKKRHF